MIPYFEEKFPQKKLGRPDELPNVYALIALARLVLPC